MAAYEDQSSILDGKKFTVSDVSLGKVKPIASGGKNVPIYSKNARRNLHISTPLMLTWGVNKWDNDSGRDSYDMTLQFPNEDYKTESTTAFLNNMMELEKFIKKSAMENCKDWFNKPKMTEEVIEALYTPMVKYPKYPKGHPSEGEYDYTRSPGIKIKIPYWSDRGFDVEIYDTNQHSLFPNEDDESITPSTLITKGSNIAIVMQCGGIWFANGKFGVTWRLFQGVVKPRATLKGKCHISLHTDEKEILENQEDEVEETVDDTDDEAEQEPDPTVEQEPVAEDKPSEPSEPPIKKKRVVKKKTT
jgi:hypothetical protein